MDEQYYDPVSQFETPVKQQRPWWFWALIGCGGVILCCVCSAVGIFGGIYWLGVSGPANVNIAPISFPSEVKADEIFTFNVQAENTADNPQTLGTVDIDFLLLDGFKVQGTSIQLAEEYEIEGFMVYDFSKEIPAEGTQAILFTAQATSTPGFYSGIIDVCMGWGFICESFDVEFSVTE